MSDKITSKWIDRMASEIAEQPDAANAFQKAEAALKGAVELGRRNENEGCAKVMENLAKEIRARLKE